MAEVTRGGWADKLRDMPQGDPVMPQDWTALDYATGAVKAPFDLFSRMTTRGQVGLMSPAEQAALASLKQYLPKEATNAFDAALEYSAAIPPGMMMRPPRAAPITMDMQIRDAQAAAAARRQAEINRFHQSSGLRPYIEPPMPKRSPSLESDVQIIPRASGRAEPPGSPPAASPPAMPGWEPPPPPPPSARPPAAAMPPMGQSVPGPVAGQPSRAPVPPPPISSEARAAAYKEVAARALNSPVFGMPMSPEIMRNMVAEVSRKYGVPFRDVINSLGEVQINTPPRPSIVAKEPPPLNAFEAAASAGQMPLDLQMPMVPRAPRPPRPTTADKLSFWDDLQAVLNHGGKVGEVDPAAAANASGLSQRMAAQRLKRAGNTGLDGQELADLIRRSIESGNWKLAVPPIAAGMIGPDEYRGQ